MFAVCFAVILNEGCGWGCHLSLLAANASRGAARGVSFHQCQMALGAPFQARFQPN